MCRLAPRTQTQELISRRQLPQHLWDSLTWILMSPPGPFPLKKKKKNTFWEGLNGGFRLLEEFVKATWHLRHLYKLLLKCIHKQKCFTFLNMLGAELMITEQSLNSSSTHTLQSHTVAVYLLRLRLRQHKYRENQHKTMLRRCFEIFQTSVWFMYAFAETVMAYSRFFLSPSFKFAVSQLAEFKGI